MGLPFSRIAATTSLMLIPSFTQVLSHPYRSLAIIFVLWKILLLLIAGLSPGLGYDTSTDLLFELNTANVDSRRYYLPQTVLKHLSARLVRWDAIYFISSAKHGYIYEQEWAFGWGVTTIIGRVAYYLPFSGIYAEAVAGILLSNLAHFLSVLVLYSLSKSVTIVSKAGYMPFIASTLHVLSPAGLFMSAPVAESLFSLFHISAMLAYCSSSRSPVDKHERHLKSDMYVLLSGALFAVACTMRSNGLFSGILYAYDLFALIFRLMSAPATAQVWRNATAVVTAGVIVLVGFLYPQIAAYRQYCRHLHGDNPTWCNALPPSITTHVQSHYWNNGFLKYWTISNAPLFLLAVPMLAVMFTSCYEAIAKSSDSTRTPREAMLLRLAMPQLILAVLTLTTFHVQIITRISSGYPLIYIWLAKRLVDHETTRSNDVDKTSKNYSSLIIRWMVVYGIVQGGLFASFLPPA